MRGAVAGMRHSGTNVGCLAERLKRDERSEAESCEADLESGDEIEESESRVERGLEETDEVFLDGSDQVRSVGEEIEESVFPEGSLERDTAMGGVFSDGAGEVAFV